MLKFTLQFQCCDLYLWLSYRFEEFTEQHLAYQVKEVISTKIEQLLLEMGGLSEYVQARSKEKALKPKRLLNETDKELLRQLTLLYDEALTGKSKVNRKN